MNCFFVLMLLLLIFRPFYSIAFFSYNDQGGKIIRLNTRYAYHKFTVSRHFASYKKCHKYFLKLRKSCLMTHLWDLWNAEFIKFIVRKTDVIDYNIRSALFTIKMLVPLYLVVVSCYICAAVNKERFLALMKRHLFPVFEYELLLINWSV